MGSINDFERIAKLNEMTKTLKQHGFADDSLSAIEQAEAIYPEYGGGSDKEKKAPTAPTPNQSPPQKDGGATQQSYEQLSTYLKSNEDFKKQIQDQIKALTTQVTQVFEKMNEMIKTINEIEAKVNAIKSNPRPVLREVPREQPVVTSGRQESPDQRSAPEPEPHHEGTTRQDGEYANQRIGSYQPGDVSIEKMFYMGKK